MFLIYFQILDVTAIVLANLCVSFIMTSQNVDAEDLMRTIEKEEERSQIQVLLFKKRKTMAIISWTHVLFSGVICQSFHCLFQYYSPHLVKHQCKGGYFIYTGLFSQVIIWSSSLFYSLQDPTKQCFHLCIVNLVIGTLYCAKGNFEFGISRIIKSLEPYNKKVSYISISIVYHYISRRILFVFVILFTICSCLPTRGIMQSAAFWEWPNL